MAETAQNILKDLKNKNYAPMYLLQGDESFYIDLISDYIEENVLSPAEKEFNQTIIYGKDSTAQQIVSAARRFPMMSQYQVIIVKEFQSLQDLNTEEGQNLLISFAENPGKETILVLCHKNKTLDKRRQFGKKIDKLAVSLTSNRIKERAIPQWISEYISSKNATITQDALRIFTEYIGADLSRLSNEIDKILVNFNEGDKCEINATLVQEFVGISKDFNVFELQKAMVKNDMGKIFYILQYFEANPKVNPPVLIVAMLYAFFSKVLIATKTKAENLAKELGVNPYFVNDYKEAARKFGFGNCATIINLIREADGKVKGVDAGSTPPGKVISELVYKIMNLQVKKS